MSHNHIDHVLGLESYLLRRIIGQDDAMTRVSRALEASEFELNERGPRPRGAYLFMGPSGVGKTETTKAFTEYLFGTSRLSMIFMNEFQSPGAVSDLVQAIERAVVANPSGTTFLFDEIEKSHPVIIDIFLSLLDEGMITANSGARIHIGNCYVVMTSNIGSSRFCDMEETRYATMEAFAFEQARKSLRPELFNRLSETIVFRPLSQDVQINILGQMMAKKLIYLESSLEKLLGQQLPAHLTIDEKSVHAHLLRKGFTQSGGARKLRDELDRQFNLASLNLIRAGVSPFECKFYSDLKNDRLELR